MALIIPDVLTFDETMTLGTLPAISLQSYDLNQMSLVTADAGLVNLQFSLNGIILPLVGGQLTLPADLPLGNTTITVSLSSDPTIQSKLTLVKKKPALTADLRHIAGLLTMHKTEVLALLGSGFAETAIGADGWMDGYYYAATGLTLAFYPEGMSADPANGITTSDLDRVIFVYCENKTDINGARVGMTPVEIAAILGAPAKFFPATDYFPLNVYRYVIEGLEIDFVSEGDARATRYAYVTLPRTLP
jgi:hypothetical protein